MSSRRTVLITGCSTGIGRASAVRLAQAGWQVIATMRDVGKAGALLTEASEAGLEVDVEQLDVTDADSVARCFDVVSARYGGLDAVVNNAGISNFDPTMEMSTLDALRENLEVNFIGMVAVSRLAMPMLRASRGRLVSIGSVHGVVGQPFNEAYCAAKSATDGFLEALAPVAAAQGVKVSLIVPGFVVDTEFGRFPHITRAGIQAASGPYEPTMAAYVDWIRTKGWEGDVSQTRAEVAEVVLTTLEDPEPAYRIPSSAWARAYLAEKLADVDGSRIQELARTWVGGAPVESQLAATH